MKLKNLLTQITFIDSSLKQKANKTINTLLTMRNWLIGYYIVEYEQNGKDRAKYGNNLLSELAEKLSIRGLSAPELSRCRQFYDTYPQILGTLPQESKKQKIAEKNELKVPGSKIISHLSFSHLVELIKIEDDFKRTFYELECIKGTWSVRELKKQINSLLFERSSLSKKPEALISKINKNAHPEPQNTLVKDIYTFEFLGLPVANAVEEIELESALIEHLFWNSEMDFAWKQDKRES